MLLTDALLGEHGAIYALFDHIERELPDLTTVTEVKALTLTLSAVLVSHARIEDELLFPALEEHIGPEGPLAVMRHEHSSIDAAILAVANAGDLESASEYLRSVMGLARAHFAKEEQVLFNIARQTLTPAQLEALGQTWSTTRHVTL